MSDGKLVAKVPELGKMLGRYAVIGLDIITSGSTSNTLSRARDLAVWLGWELR